MNRSGFRSGMYVRHRRWLAATTAIVAFMAIPAHGQSLPNPGNTTTNDNGNTPVFNPGNNRLDISLRADNTIINWNGGFNIPENGTVRFDRGLGLKAAVLNRDLSGNPSQILGTLSSGSNVAVWVMNGSGIMVGSKANINTGSLVLSTLNMTDADFLDRNGNFALSTAANSQSAITVMNGARIKVEGGNRGLIMVAPKIDAYGSFEAVNQDVAFITASDVDLTFNPGSPLSIKINRGTAVSGRSQLIRGTVAGADALFALASQGSVTDSLLQVDASVTTATSGTRGIVLSAGRLASAVDGVTVAGNPADTGGIANLIVRSNLTSTDNDGSDILAGASGSASFTGALSSRRDIRLTGGGDVTVAGAVTARGDYAVDGLTVTLGGTTPVLQSADGAIDITASRALTGKAGLTLLANADGSLDREALTLAATFDGTTTNVPSGTINFAPGTILKGGANRESSVRIRSGASNGSVTLGTVVARSLVGAVGTAGFDTGILRQAAVTTGDISLTDQIKLQGTTLTTGALTSGDAVTLTTTAGALKAGAIDADRAVTLTSAGALTTGAIQSGRSILVDAVGDAIFGGDLDADDDLILRGASVRLNGQNVTSGGTIDLQARVGGISSVAGLRLISTSADTSDFVRLQAAGTQGINLSSTGRITAGTNRALRVAVRNEANGATLVLGDVTARALTGLSIAGGNPATNAAPIVSNGSLAFGNLNLIESFSARSNAGSLSVASIAVTGAGQGISLAAPVGALTIQSTIRASGDVTLIGGSPIILDTVESTNGRASVTSNSTVRLNTLAGALGVSATGASVTLQNVRGGTVSINSTAGGIILGKVDGDDVTLNAIGGNVAVTDTVTSSGSVSATGTAAILFTKAIQANGGGVTVSAGTGEAAVLGNVTAAGDYRVTGKSVTLGGRQEARGLVAITATGGAIVGQSGLLLASDTDGASGEALILSATGGGISLTANSLLSGGRFRQSVVTATTDAGSVALGDVTARSLVIAAPTGAATPISTISTRDLLLSDGFTATAANGVTTGSIGVSGGGVTIEGGVGAVQTGAISAAGAVSLTGASVDYGSISGRGVGVKATTGNVSGGNITSIGAIDVNALSGTISLGRLTATGTDGNVSLASLGTLFATRVTADGTATLTTTAATADVRLEEGLTANGAVNVAAGRDIRASFISSTGSTLTVSAPTGDVTGFQNGGSIDLSAGPGQAFSLTVGRAVQLGNILGGPTSITASSISVGAINVGGNAISLNANNGDLTVRGNVVAGDATFTSTGNTSLQSISAIGALTLSGGTGLSFTDISGASVSATSNGAIIGSRAFSAGAINITGASLSLRLAQANGALALTATNGEADLGNLSSGQDITVLASGRATGDGDVTAVGNYQVTGKSVVLGGQQEARGAVTITATGGGIFGQSNLVLASDTDGASGEALILSATGGGISLAANSLLSGGKFGQSAVTATTDAGSVALGDVTARSLVIAAPTGAATPISTISTRNLLLSDGFTATAANGVTTGSIGVSGGGVMINGGAGAVQTGAISAAGAVSLTGGSVSYDAISGRGVGIEAATGNVSGGNITSIGAINVNAVAGTISLGRLTATGADGNVSLTSAGTLLATRVTADGTATLKTGAGADVKLEEGLTANGAVNVEAGHDIRASFIRSTGGTLTVSAPTGDVTGFQNGSSIDLSAGPGQAFSLTVGRAVQLGNIEGGPTSITASSISVGAINVGGNAISLIANGGNLTVRGDVVAGDTTFTATGTTSLQSVAATGALTLSGGAGLSFVNISGTNVSASSNREIIGDTASATGSMTFTGGSLSLGEAHANGPLALTATSSNATLGKLYSGQDITVLANGHAAINGDVTAGGAYKVTGASVTLGDGAVTQRAGGAIVITALNGDISGRPGLTLSNLGATGAPAIVLDTTGGIALAGSTIRTGGALGLRAGAEKTIELGTIEAGVVGGYDGSVAGGALRHSASMTTGDIITGAIDVGLTAGDLTTGLITSTGAVNLVTTSGGITTGAVQGASIRLAAGGILSAASVSAAGAASLAGAQVQVDTVRAASIQIGTAGALTGIGDGRASLRSTSGNIDVDAGNMKLGTVDSSEGLALNGNAIDIAGKLTASRQALVKARSTLTMADASAGTDLTLGADGAMTAGVIAANGAITITGRGIKVTDARAGGALSLTSGAELQLGTGQAGGAAIIDAVGLATLGALTAGPSITIRASDVALTGLQRAGSITFQNSAAATSTMRLGDDTATGGFRLSNAEIALVNADAVRFDQGAGALQIGALTFGADTGRRTVDMLTTGAIAVDGTVKGSGLGRAFRIGGGATEGSASEIRVTATSTGGGRLLFDNANLDLRGDRIAVGLASGFLSVLTPGAGGSAQALAFINNGNSALYNAGLGGGFYDPAATTLISAHSLSLRFADYALIQNTGVPGQFSGVALGGTLGNPATPALTVRATSIGGGFALFGTINGVGGPSASLLGPSVIDIDPVLLANSRINGCLAGSGVGCLTTIVIQPTLQIFKWSSDDVFGVAQDVSTPFDPVIGGNNEELLTGLPALSPERESAEEGLPQ
ncbi:filamentous hemagglutinin N-terminal domain-containing protein [Sphingomonas sp.]|uniref:two-partner secretion domain-containing protein n=1 Tax=Sphingomonas sp. TaxID=28214 RepID=UPI003D6D022D